MKKLYIGTTIFTVLIAVFSNVYGLPGESVVLDPNTGDYLITYYGAGAPGDKKNKKLQQIIFVPATKIEPFIRSTFKFKEDRDIVYSYRVTNGLKSRQSLISILFDPITDIDSALPLTKRLQDVDRSRIAQVTAAGVSAIITPEDWIGRNTTSRMGGLRIGWGYGDLSNSSDGLVPGKTQNGFGYSSKDLPGIIMAQFRGHAPVPSYPDEGPTTGSDVNKQLDPIKQHNFVTRPAAVPSIAVPTPFNASVLLGSIQIQMHTWIGMQLLDSTFSSQLDRYLTAAAAAYSHNQHKVVKEDLEKVREMLKREHQDMDRDEDKEDVKSADKAKHIMIDRLAARVLDFNLQYVLKRMNKDHDD